MRRNPHQARSVFRSPQLRRLRPAFAAAAALAVASLAGSTAHAQQVSGEFSVQRFSPAPGPRNFITTRGVRTDGKMAFSAGFVANYAFEPFIVVSRNGNNGRVTTIPVVENMITGDVVGSFTPIPRLQLGLRVPVTWVKGQGITDDGNPDPEGIKAVGLGDIELEGKFRFAADVNKIFIPGVAIFATGPLGHATSEGNYIGDSTPAAGLRLIADGARGPLSFGANVGGVVRGSGKVGDTELGPEFRYSVAAGYKVSPVFRVVVDGFGATSFSTNKGENSLEADLGVQIIPLSSPIAIQAGAGTGLLDGIGSPTVRAFLGVMFVSEKNDRDSDGLGDNADQCPTDAEDLDGYEDSDGCPEADNDLDEIPDSADKCASESEDVDGFEDTDGCPERDNDKDGIKDEADRCKNEAETKNGFKDDDGCPDVPDSDGDGVPDTKDQCAAESEDTDGYQDTDGCPDPDNDADAVPDDSDECIDEAETYNGFEDENGCPDTPPKGFKPPRGWKKPVLPPTPAQ
jgi:OmpA-OmpF porin, OOP family